MVNSAQTAIVALQDKIVPATFSIAGSAASGTIVTATLYPFGLQNPATSTNFQVPAGSNYQLSDMYVPSTPAVDGQLIFQLNGVTQGENLVLSTMVSSNSARARLSQPLVLKPSDVLTVQIVTAAANSSTAAATDTLYLHFLQIPA